MQDAIRFLPAHVGDTQELDRVAGAPHPREMLSLIGQAGAERAFLELCSARKLHHAFLLNGPEGVGKASFAYRAARFLLSEGEREGAGGSFGSRADESLDVAEDSRTAHLVAHESHPDLGVLKRRYDPKTKKFRSEISVEDTRNALSLFEKTAAFGGWRVIIVDAADDLNASSANALLKTLEEPPERAVFLLVTHQPQRLLPTIRSRCRMLNFSPLSPEHIKALMPVISKGASLDDSALERAKGSIKRALRLGQPGFRAYLALIDEVLGALPKRRYAEIDRIAEACRAGSDGEQALSDFLENVEGWLQNRIHAFSGANEVEKAAEMAEFWGRMSENATRLDALNLDRRAFVMTLVDELATLVSGSQR